MVDIFQLQPDGSLKGPIDWSLFLGWDGDPIVSDPIYLPVSFDDTGVPYTPQTPLAPTLTALLTTRTTVDIDWVPASGFTGPAILQWEVDVQTSSDNGVTFGAWNPILGSPFAHDDLDQSLIGLATGTPEIIFRYRARGINGDGNGDYSMYQVQWQGVVINPPKPPRTLTVTNITPTSVRLSWTASVDASTDGGIRYGVWSANTDLNVPIDPNATTFLWTGLTPAHDYLNINIRRINAGGWSGGTNYVDFTTPRTARQTVDDPVMGQSVPDNQTAYRTSIPALRLYGTGDVGNGKGNTKPGIYNPRVIAYTDDNFSNGGPSDTNMAYVDHVKTMLDNFNADPANLDCEVHVAYGNEIDRNWTTGSLSTAFINVYAALRDLIWGTTGGQRDYPNASVWVDMTANNIRSNGSGPRFKAIARYLDGMACSNYPAGRTIQASNPLIEYDPISYPTGSIWTGNSRNALRYYLDPVFAALSDWRATGGVGGVSIASQLNQFATWEIGIPIHHSLDSGALTNLVRTGADATDITQRPRYLVGGSRVTGPANQQYNMKGFLSYIADKCDAEDVSMREQLYWNQWSNTLNDDSPGTSIPNPWGADVGKTNPDSVTAWYSWYIGYRLADI